MRNHWVRLGLILMLAALAELGCSQSGADPNNEKNPKHSAESARDPNSTTPNAASGKGSTDGTEQARDAHEQTGIAASEKRDGTSTGNTSAPLQAPPWWLGDPIILGLIGVLIFLGLALHVVHVVTDARFRKESAALRRAIQTVSNRGPIAYGTEYGGAPGGPNGLTQRLDRHRQGLDQLGSQIREIEQRVAVSERCTADTATAVGLAAHMAGQPRIRLALGKSAVHGGEADRASVINVLERYEDFLSVNEVRTRSLVQETCDLAEWLSGRPNLPAELAARVDVLQSDVVKFAEWRLDASERLASLRRGSISDRYSRFSASLADLAGRFDAQAISIADYVKGYGELLERDFPPDADDSVSIDADKQEAELREITASVPDYLMDWFDSFSQLQAQAAQAEIDAETAARLTQIKRTAKDVLTRFDIQPEEIQVGVTTFDRRLHDVSLITQSAQYPANTVVGVQQSGFRKLSTGDVLRRPKVIVAGVGAAL